MLRNPCRAPLGQHCSVVPLLTHTRGATTQTSCSAAQLHQQLEASPVMRMLLQPQRMGSNNCPFRSLAWRRGMTVLYRVILKLHAMKLEPAQRTFGDKFVKSEFRRHAMANEKYAHIFYASWYDYVLQLDRGVTSRSMSKEEQALLSDEQRAKLAEIRSYVVQQRHTDGDFTL